MPIPAELAPFWSEAVKSHPGLDDARFYEAFCFGDNESLANSLAELVLRGQKRATAGLSWAFEAENKPIPRPGDLSVVTNWARQPLCIIETTAVQIVPFDQVTEAFARTEGEDDGTLVSWHKGHTIFFGRECARLGRTLIENALVVCETFRIVYQRGCSASAV